MDYITKPAIMTAETQRNMIFSLKNRYPSLGVCIMGKSLCQRRIFALRIGRSKNPLLIAAGFHGQEWLTTLLSLRFAEILLHSRVVGTPVFGINATHICREVIIVPCVNPDGVQIAISGADSAWKFAENVSKIMSASCEKWNANARGIDINHNFNAGWSQLRSMEIDSGIVAPSPRRYGGFMPESEPETIALVNLTKARRPRTAIALHSQGKEIYWEYGNKNPPESKRLAQILSAASGYTLVENSGLASHGGYKDWFIEYFGKPGFTIEIGKGENPLPLSDFDEILYDTVPMLTLAALL